MRQNNGRGNTHVDETSRLHTAVFHPAGIIPKYDPRPGPRILGSCSKSVRWCGSLNNMVGRTSPEHEDCSGGDGLMASNNLASVVLGPSSAYPSAEIGKAIRVG